MIGAQIMLASFTLSSDSIFLKKQVLGTSLVVQWGRLCALNAGGLGSIPGQGTRSCMHAATKSPQAAAKTRRSQNNK